MALFQYQQTAIPPQTTPTVPPLAWAPEFADFGGAAPRVVPTSGTASFVQTSVPTLLAWRAEYVDRLPAPVYVVGNVRAVPLEQTSVPVLTAWIARYVDNISALTQTAESNETMPPNAQSVIPLLEAWHSLYPDLVPVTQRHAIESLFAHVWVSTLLRPLQWQGAWPDFVRDAQPSLDVGGESLVRVPPVAPTLTFWTPVFPAFVRSQSQATVGAFLLLFQFFGPVAAQFVLSTAVQPLFADLSEQEARYILEQATQALFGGESTRLVQ